MKKYVFKKRGIPLAMVFAGACTFSLVGQATVAPRRGLEDRLYADLQQAQSQTEKAYKQASMLDKALALFPRWRTKRTLALQLRKLRENERIMHNRLLQEQGYGPMGTFIKRNEETLTKLIIALGVVGFGGYGISQMRERARKEKDKRFAVKGVPAETPKMPSRDPEAAASGQSREFASFNASQAGMPLALHDVASNEGGAEEHKADH